MDSHINVGTGVECTIRELAETSMQVVGHASLLVWDRNKPAVTPCKMMDVSPLATLGRRAQVGLADGSQEAYRSLLLHHAEARL
jgi:GDP-L-fucose synthase